MECGLLGRSTFLYGSESGNLGDQLLPPALDLSALHSLRHFTVQADMKHELLLQTSTDGGRYSTTIPYISSILKTLPKRKYSTIRRITVGIQIYDMPQRFWDSLGWSRLIRDLADEERLVDTGADLELKLNYFYGGDKVVIDTARLMDIWKSGQYLKGLVGGEGISSHIVDAVKSRVYACPKFEISP